MTTKKYVKKNELASFIPLRNGDFFFFKSEPINIVIYKRITLIWIFWSVLFRKYKNTFFNLRWEYRCPRNYINYTYEVLIFIEYLYNNNNKKKKKVFKVNLQLLDWIRNEWITIVFFTEKQRRRMKKKNYTRYQ